MKYKHDTENLFNVKSNDSGFAEISYHVVSKRANLFEFRTRLLLREMLWSLNAIGWDSYSANRSATRNITRPITYLCHIIKLELRRLREIGDCYVQKMWASFYEYFKFTSHKEVFESALNVFFTFRNLYLDIWVWWDVCSSKLGSVSIFEARLCHTKITYLLTY